MGNANNGLLMALAFMVEHILLARWQTCLATSGFPLERFVGNINFTMKKKRLSRVKIIKFNTEIYNVKGLARL